MNSTPFSIEKLDHVVLRVRDPARAIAFYTSVLGLTVEREQAELGLIQLRAGSALIDLVGIDGKLGRMGGAPPGEEARNVDHFALKIAPFDEEAIRAYLAANNVEITEAGPRYGADGTGPSIYIRDPDGNGVELKG